MCDSGVGASVAATRQNAGVFIGAAVAAAPGARNVPASTGTAAVMVASGSVSLPSASHAVGVCADAEPHTNAPSASWSAKRLSRAPAH